MDNCYSCPFASEKRVSDITIGDYWGIYHEHGAEIRQSNLDNRAGISCALINSSKGMEFWNTIKNDLNYFESKFSKVAKHNEQLVRPSAKPENRAKILDMYAHSGYESVDLLYNKQIRLKKYAYILEFYMPKSLKRNIKKMVGNLKYNGEK